MGDTLRVRVTAPPERGKANAAVLELLGQRLGLATGKARIVAGGASPRKTVEVVGLTDAEIRRRLAGSDGHSAQH